MILFPPAWVRRVRCAGFLPALLGVMLAVPAAAGEREAIERVVESVVRIDAIRLRPDQGRLQKARIGGSGVIISDQGHVLTNYHVADDVDYYRCYLADGTRVEAKRIGQDALSDLAVLQLDLAALPKGRKLRVARFGDSAAVATGDTVYAVGSPASLSQSVTRGIVSSTSLVLPDTMNMILDGENVGEVVRWILHDASIFHGNSGGPLLNARGEIIGINELGVASLGGAIPGNLARAVSTELIRHGTVTRGWSGLTVQARLAADRGTGGVLVADVAPGSPAAAAGLQPGDILDAIDGHAIEGTEEKSVASFNRLEMGTAPGTKVRMQVRRAGAARVVDVVLAGREPAEAPDVEVAEWGAVVRNLTRDVVRAERLPDRRGVWVENVRPAGPAGQAEPELRRRDVIVSVDGQPVADVSALRALSAKLLPPGAASARPVLVQFRRDGALLSATVELRRGNPRNVTAQARKAWLGVVSQPLTARLATQLGIKAEGGARLTQVYADTAASAAGLAAGDVILAIDGAPVQARRVEDVDLLARQIRQYRAGTEVKLTLWRNGEKRELPVLLSEQPAPSGEMPWWDAAELEFTAREISFEDRVRLQLPASTRGVVVESTVPSGWAALAGLRSDDLILRAGDAPITTIADLKAAADAARAAGGAWWVLLVERRGQTQFIEIRLSPSNP